MEATLWINNDLTFFAGATPIEGISAIDGCTQNDNSQHVNVMTGDGHIHEFYRNPNPAAQWVYNDLTALAKGVPAYCAALAGYSQADNSQHVFFIDENGHVHELYRSAALGAQWVDNDLTAFASAPPAAVLYASSALAAFSDDDNGQWVIFMDEQSNVHALYRSPNPAAQWVDFNMPLLARGSQSYPSAPFAGYSQSDGSKHVYFMDLSGHVHELYLGPNAGAQWVDNNLTGFAGGSPALFNALDAYTQADNSQHVNFIDANGHVHELYRSPDPTAQWADHDLTVFAAGTPAGLGSVVVSCPRNDGKQHVCFIDGNGHIHDLYRYPLSLAQWVDLDLNAQGGGSRAADSGLLDVYFQSDGSQHANFISMDEHVHELYSLLSGPWPTFQHDWRRTGLSPIDTSGNTGQQKWAYQTSGGGGGSSAVIGADGALYFASDDGYLYAVHSDGTLKWKSQIAGIESIYQQCTPAIGPGGTLYFQSMNSDAESGLLRAVSPDDGSVLWKLPTGAGGNIASPAIGQNGTIYFGPSDGNLYAVNPDGTLKWSFAANSGVSSSPAIAADGTIYFGSDSQTEGQLYAVIDGGQNNASLRWTYPTGSILQLSPAIGADGAIYVGTQGAVLFAVAPDGTLKWQFPIPGGFGTVINSSPAVGANNTIYLGSSGAQTNVFLALNPDGTSKWSFSLSADSQSSAAIGADGTIYVGSGDGNLRALQDNGPGNAVVKWTFSTNGAIEASPAIGADGTIYIFSDDGNLYAVK